MTKTTIDVARVPSLTHEEAMRLQAHELDRMLALLRSLDDAAWNAQTDCPAWDVKAMYRHVLGECEAGASMRENIHHSVGLGPTASDTAGRSKPRCRPCR
jgi:hypothetical protein